METNWNLCLMFEYQSSIFTPVVASCKGKEKKVPEDEIEKKPVNFRIVIDAFDFDNN